MTLAGTGDVVAITAELDEVTRENAALRHMVGRHADEIDRCLGDMTVAFAEAQTARERLRQATIDLQNAYREIERRDEEIEELRRAGRQLVAELTGICDAAESQPAMRCLAALRVELNQRFPWDEAPG